MDSDSWQWAVEIEGHEFDLAHLEATLRPEFTPTVQRLAASQNALVLLSPSFDEQPDAASVRVEARRLVALLNGTVAIEQRGAPLKAGRVFSIEGGLLRVHAFLEAEPIVSRSFFYPATLSAIDAHGNPVPPPPPSPSFAQRVVELASKDQEVAYLLHATGRADNWFDLYNALDVLPHVAGSKADWSLLLGSDERAYRDVRQEANGHRHKPPQRWPTPRPSLPQARDLLGRLSRRVLEHRLRSV